MKKGDLVKLVLPGNTAGWPAGVVVSWQRDVGQLDERNFPTRFPEGTLAVFLGDDLGRDRDDHSILIGGRVGWVWSKYLEVL